MATTRLTTQRIKILDYLKSVKNHPSAEAVCHAVKKELPSITLATVYRNLDILADQGKIQSFKVNNEYHYDGNMRRHQHCICADCGKIIDSFNEKIPDFAMKNISVKPKDFKAERVCIIFKGKCGECAGKNKNKRQGGK